MKTLAGARAADAMRLAELSAEKAELARTLDGFEDRLAQAERDKEALATARTADAARLAALSADKAELARTLDGFEDRLAQTERDKESGWTRLDSNRLNQLTTWSETTDDNIPF